MTVPVTPPPDESPGKISPGKAAEPITTPPSTKPPGDFQSYMQGTAGKPPAGTPPGVAGGPTPMQAMQPAAMQHAAAPNFTTVLAQAKQAQDSLGTIADQLKTPNLKFKRSQSHLLRNKLHDAHTYLRDASQKMGVEAPPMEMPAGAGALERFIAYVNHGQTLLNNTQERIQELSAKQKQLSPADFLFVQVKMSQAQQEIEYSSTLLSKVVDSIKALINVQL